MGWWWERSDPVFPRAARRPAIGLVAPTTAPVRASASGRGCCERSSRRRGHPGRSSPGYLKPRDPDAGVHLVLPVDRDQHRGERLELTGQPELAGADALAAGDGTG